MTTRAGTEGVTAEQILDLLCETFLSGVGENDEEELIPRELLHRVIPPAVINFMNTIE